MCINVISINKFSLTNHSEETLTVIIEPEGDVIDVPPGVTFTIKFDHPPKKLFDFEIETALNNVMTISLLVFKEVYLNDKRIR